VITKLPSIGLNINKIKFKLYNQDVLSENPIDIVIKKEDTLIQINYYIN